MGDAEGGEEGEVKEADWPRQEAAAVQPAVCERAGGRGQEEGTEHAAPRQDGLDTLPGTARSPSPDAARSAWFSAHALFPRRCWHRRLVPFRGDPDMSSSASPL